MANPAYQEILAEIKNFSGTAHDLPALQEYCVRLMADKLPLYNWVGFYMVDPADDQMLILGPFHGAPTEHVRIPVSEGICGVAVAQDQTVIVEDVASDPRYISCSIETRSEIVVPIRAFGKVVGEIDIDSHALSAFGDEDRVFLEECAALFGAFIETVPVV
jgi:L-methionine (R)-S-oxide reductase